MNLSKPFAARRAWSCPACCEIHVATVRPCHGASELTVENGARSHAIAGALRFDQNDALFRAVMHAAAAYPGRTALSTKAVGRIKALAHKAAGAAEMVG